MKAKILLLDGTLIDLPTWQARYNLTVGSSQIGRYFNIGEPNFKSGLTISEAIIRVLDVIRFIRDQPTNVNSLDRTAAYQKQLREQGYRAATYSPHVVKMGADIDTISNEDTYDLLDVIDEASDILGYTIRIGWKGYMKSGQTFVHIDVCPMYYAPGKVWHNKQHPIQWENKSEW